MIPFWGLSILDKSDRISAFVNFTVWWKRWMLDHQTRKDLYLKPWKASKEGSETV